jgi:hypothetical protein
MARITTEVNQEQIAAALWEIVSERIGLKGIIYRELETIDGKTYAGYTPEMFVSDDPDVAKVVDAINLGIERDRKRGIPPFRS